VKSSLKNICEFIKLGWKNLSTKFREKLCFFFFFFSSSLVYFNTIFLFSVEELGIKEFLPAYRDPTLQPKDLLTGVSFASGGTGYDPLTSELVVCAS
jgi:hypothetical protein